MLIIITIIIMIINIIIMYKKDTPKKYFKASVSCGSVPKNDIYGLFEPRVYLNNLML